MKRMIMMHGLPACGKSTLAGKIRKLGGIIIKSEQFKEDDHADNDTIDEDNDDSKKIRDNMYRSMVRYAKERLDEDESILPILDATHHKLYRREWVYDFAKENNISLYVIWCYIDDESILERIFEERRKSKTAFDNQLASMDMYNTMKGQTEAITDDEIDRFSLRVARYNWSAQEVRFINPDPFLKGLLGKIQGIAPKKHDP